jgi:Spy/CpxP family protein refolding chaperone
MRFEKTLIGSIALLCAACVLVSISPVLAQMPSGSAPSQKQLDIAAARAQRKAIVGSNMLLTDAEGAKFWPLYDEYEAKMDKIDDRHLKELKDFAATYDKMGNADAAKKLDEVMSIAQARLDVQKAYIPKFRAVISGIKTTRFFQMDNKLFAVRQCALAQLVPLAASPAEQSKMAQ